jgi:hypothetical protein
VRRVVHAVTTAKQEPDDPSCTPGPWFGFFKGTNFLGGFRACGRLFWVDEPYFDTTGTLELLQARLREEEMKRVMQQMETGR